MHHVYSSTWYSIGWASNPPPPPRHIWAHIRGRYWSANQDRRHLFVTPCFTLSHGDRSTKFIWPRNPPPPPHLGSYTRALLVSQDLFVTPCFTLSNSFFRPPGPINLSGLISRKTRDMQAMCVTYRTWQPTVIGLDRAESLLDNHSKVTVARIYRRVIKVLYPEAKSKVPDWGIKSTLA